MKKGFAVQVANTAHTMGKMQSGDVEIGYRKFAAKHGSETPVLILHGLSYFSYDWIGIASRLCDERDVVAMDMRGFGESSWSPTKSYGLKTMAGDIGAVCDHFGWEKVILVGHSMGGRTSSYFASEHPNRVKRLVLVDYSPVNAPDGGMRVTRSVGNQPDEFDSVDSALEYFGFDKSLAGDHPKRLRMIEYLRPTETGFQPKRDLDFRDRFKKILDGGEKQKLPVDMWEAIAKIRCPILVLRGSTSDMFAPESAERMKVTNPQIELIEVAGGHNLPGENPDAIVEHVAPFISGKAALLATARK